MYLNDRIDLDSEGHAKPVLHGGLLRDNKDTPNTKPQQQVNPSNQPTAKNPKDTKLLFCPFFYLVF
jgi:hypothetical protein